MLCIDPRAHRGQVGLEVGFPATGGRVGGRVFWAKRGLKSDWEVGSAVGSEVGSFGGGQEPEVTGRSGWRSGLEPKFKGVSL